VGHSYGGQIMNALGADAPAVVDSSTSLRSGSTRASRSPPSAVTHGSAGAGESHRRRAGLRRLPQDDFVSHFAADVDPVKARVMHAAQQPVAMSVFDDVMGTPAWKSLHSWYLVAANDEAIAPDAERMFRGANGSGDGRGPLEPCRNGLPPGWGGGAGRSGCARRCQRTA